MISEIFVCGIKVIIFRDDLNHATVSGNKLHKLVPNINIAQQQGCSSVLSFGGPYSNHLHALAWACKEVGLDSVGVIRGELSASMTPTLVDCKNWGMQLIPLSRKAYRQYQNELSSFSEPVLASDLTLEQTLLDLKNKKDTLVVPEGGSNLLAIESISNAYQAVFDSLKNQKVTHAVCATGTGATVAGLRLAAPDNVEIIGMQAVAEQQATLSRITGWLGVSDSNLTIRESHLGRFAKVTDELISFMDEFETQYKIPLDPIYTAKAMYELINIIEEGYFNQHHTILFIHTGGLQGKRRD